jgi:putative MATE family efflux protein
LEYAREYLMMMLFGLIPFAINNAYSSTLRETGQSVVPMVAGICAVLVNLVLNWVLIFGHFGLPAMGVRGAALATVISRYVELIIVVVWTHKNKDKNPYIRGVYRSWHIPGPLLKQIFIKGLPLILNETLFSAGLAFLNQCYSVCGLDVVPALSISSTIYNLTAVIFRSLGITVGILTGQMLGAGLSAEEVRDSNRKQIALCVASGVVFGGVTALLCNSFPQIFKTTDEVRQLAGYLILISAICMPLHAYIMPAYFTLRSGGKTFITFLFDCGSIWALMLPLAFVLTRFTDMPIIPVYILCNSVDIIKCVIGVFLIRGGSWIQNLTAK